ncbi:hypothetical protein [Pararobbsia silviterrae]|uniref:hypothetical protein n=1 Tax=Pararobbsia silviterrae TaxID=1792498 RepID=UPI0011C46C40|nr:hypothetical protein [Pararobbsia silviterrae]
MFPPEVRSIDPPIPRALARRLKSVALAACIVLAACGGHDDADTSSRDAASNTAALQSASPAVANAADPAASGLAPPVMHYAQ